jgi:hypothetical protein
MQTMAPPEDALTERLARLDERIVAVDRRVAETAKETDRRITEGREETSRRFDRVEGDFGELKKSVIEIHATLTRISVGVGLTIASVVLTKAL